MTTERPRGRATKLTPELQEALVEAVSNGVPYHQAALLADIGTYTAHEWRARGEGRDPDRPQTPLYASFAQAIQKAEAENEARHLRIIREAARGGVVTEEATTVFPDGREMTTVKRTLPQWHASAWWLERRYPERYALRTRLDITLAIQALAARIAERLGLDAQEVIREAQAILADVLPQVKACERRWDG